MTAVMGRVWGWVRPQSPKTAGDLKTTTGTSGDREATTGTAGDMNIIMETAGDPKTTTGRASDPKTNSWGFKGWPSWVWGGHDTRSDQTNMMEEYWEAQEKLQPVDVEDLRAGKRVMELNAEPVPRWWSKILPPSYLFWSRKPESSGLRQRRCVGRDNDNDGEFSDYGTPPPSPTPPSRLAAPLRLFARSWTGAVLPEHYEICFNFLRHLFDLFVVGFLWTVSPPTKVLLEVLGVHGALRLWLHGMAMFFVSTVGMAGLLWMIQEYLPQFALIYGIVQALVISVSVRQSVILGGGEEEKDDEGREGEGVKDDGEHKETKQVYEDYIQP